MAPSVSATMRKGNFEGKGMLHCQLGTFCRELRKNRWSDRGAVREWTRVGPRKHVLDGANPNQYDWTVHVRRRCGFFVKLRSCGICPPPVCLSLCLFVQSSTRLTLWHNIVFMSNRTKDLGEHLVESNNAGKKHFRFSTKFSTNH